MFKLEDVQYVIGSKWKQRYLVKNDQTGNLQLMDKVPAAACKTCHPNGEYTVEKYMPNTGKTAENLFVRTHTFGKNPRQGGKGAADMGPPNHYE